MKSMMHLVNRESVICEMVLLAREGLSTVLGVTPDDVDASVRVEGGTIRPEFSVSANALGDVEPDEVREAMAQVWLPVKAQMQTRLSGLSVRR